MAVAIEHPRSGGAAGEPGPRSRYLVRGDGVVLAYHPALARLAGFRPMDELPEWHLRGTALAAEREAARLRMVEARAVEKAAVAGTEPVRGAAEAVEAGLEAVDGAARAEVQVAVVDQGLVTAPEATAGEVAMDAVVAALMAEVEAEGEVASVADPDIDAGSPGAVDEVPVRSRVVRRKGRKRVRRQA